LDFTVPLTKSGTTYSIDFIEEDDARLLGSSQLEDFSDHPSTFTHISLNELGSNNSDKGGISSVGNSSGSQSLSCAGRPVEQNTLGRVNTELDEALWMKQRQLNNLSDLLNLLFAATEIIICHVWLILYCHHCH
jgi:hypothetical protein